MNDVSNFVDEVRKHAQEAGLTVWQGFPLDAPSVDFPEDTNASSLVRFAVDVGAKVLYLATVTYDPDSAYLVFAGVAVSGVVHRIVKMSPERQADLDYRPGLFGGLGFDIDIKYEDRASVSWSEQQYKALSPDLQERVDRIIDHPTYGLWRGSNNIELLDEIAGNLSPAEYKAVKEVAWQRFREVHGERLDVEGARLAAKLIDHDALDPLTEWGDWESWVTDHVEPGTDRRVVVRAARGLARLVDEKGLREMAMGELRVVAGGILESLPSGVRDQLGFMSRNRQREALIDSYLPAGLTGHRREWVTREIVYLEAERFSATREARYATAASILMADHGVSKSATSRILGISTSIIDRITRENSDRVTLAVDDPLIAMDARLTPTV